MKRIARQAWPILAVLSGVAAALLLQPAEPEASWWPTAEWAQHGLTGVAVGIAVLLIGVVLGAMTGSISLPGLKLNNAPDHSRDLNEIRSQLAAIIQTQQKLTETSAAALALAKEAIRGR